MPRRFRKSCLNTTVYRMMVGGRRTAAIVAAQYLKRIPCISTVYVGSSESRAFNSHIREGDIQSNPDAVERR